MRPTRAALDALTGFAVAAALGAAGHLANLAATVAPASDDASQRISAELVRLGHETSAFAVAVALAVTLATGLIGAALALLIRLIAPRARNWLWTALATLLVLALLVLRAFLRQPALLEPALGGPQALCAPLYARMASSLSPHFVDAIFLAAALALALARRSARIGMAAALALIALLQLPRLWAPRPGATLLILAADSLRPDHLTVAPHLQELQQRGVSFDAALSPMASTTPAWVSLLTGSYPHAHGIRTMFPRRPLRADWLDTLPRRLAAAGFRTSVVADYAGDFFPTFDFGFQHQRVPPPLTLLLVYQRELLLHSALALALFNHGVGHALFPVFRFLPTNADPERLADQVLDELRASSGRKSAVVAFFSTTHVPFAAPHPHYKDFASPLYGGTHRYLYDIQKLADLTGADVALPTPDVEQVRHLYDGSVAAVDAAIGRILAQLDEQTTVVVLADHGENLFEPGNTTFHGKWFRGGDEANRVPLIWAGPHIAHGLRVSEPVSLVDVASTLLAVAGLPSATPDGVSLQPALMSGHAPPHDVFAETAVWLSGPPETDGVRYPPLPQLLEADPRDHFQIVLKTRFEDVEVEAKHRMLRRNKIKLLYLPTVAGVRWRQFDMEADPHQEHALEPSPELQHALEKFLARDPVRELDAREHVVRRSED